MPVPCYVLLPDGAEKVGAGDTANSAYESLIVPAILAAGFEPLRPTGPLAEALFNEARLAQLLDEFPDDIQRLKTDVFRERVDYAVGIKTRLSEARQTGPAAIHEVEAQLGDIALADAAVVIDLYLSYRAASDWPAMIALAGRMAPPLAATVMVREQLALALNRAGRGEEAEAMLLQLIAEHGTNSETCSLLGRVYKDRWQAARDRGDMDVARGLLDKAIAAYLQGFEADWRDAYPGVNAVTLMELKEPPDPRQTVLLPVVRYAVERRIVGGAADYWDYATRLELAILAHDQAGAEAALADALAHVREHWEPETTARNLSLIADVRRARGEDVDVVLALSAALAGARR